MRALRIGDNEAAIRRHTSTIDEHNIELDWLSSRIRALERSGSQSASVQVRRAKLTDEYVATRRSVRLWSICGADLWGEVGKFLHGTLRIPGCDLCQEDIESISSFTTRVNVILCLPMLQTCLTPAMGKADQRRVSGLRFQVSLKIPSGS